MLLDFGTDYAAIDHRNSDPAKLGIAFERVDFANAQHFDFDGVKGRLMSSSYVPEPGQPLHGPMLAELRRIFDLHQVDGRVAVLYTTQSVFRPDKIRVMTEALHTAIAARRNDIITFMREICAIPSMDSQIRAVGERFMPRCARWVLTKCASTRWATRSAASAPGRA